MVLEIATSQIETPLTQFVERTVVAILTRSTAVQLTTADVTFSLFGPPFKDVPLTLRCFQRGPTFVFTRRCPCGHLVFIVSITTITNTIVDSTCKQNNIQTCLHCFGCTGLFPTTVIRFLFSRDTACRSARFIAAIFAIAIIIVDFGQWYFFWTGRTFECFGKFGEQMK